MTSTSDIKFFIEVFVTLFVIMDPPGTIPLFLSLTSGRTQRMRKGLASQAVVVSFFVITIFALFG
ncbi:MAG: MarC family protein, partial [Acidimicrobiales bacterium]